VGLFCCRRYIRVVKGQQEKVGDRRLVECQGVYVSGQS
jgi:hypothetical protein